MTMIRLARTARTRYRASWIGTPANPSRGLLTVITAAMVALAVTVPWLIDRNGEAARAQVELNALADQRRDCVRAAQSGDDLKATSLAGVEHAEQTAHLMQSIRDILVANAPQSPSVQAIAAQIDAYVVGVAEFRRVAEKYHPRTLAECRVIGAGVLEPLPPDLTTDPPGG